MNNNLYPGYMYDQPNQMNWPKDNNFYYPQNINPQDERFFLAPFVVGGLAGTALGYGIANNNQINKGGPGCCGQPVYFYPQPQPYPYPYMYSNTNFYN